MEVAEDLNNTVFISYSHRDNENTLGEGWVEQFHMALLQRLDIITADWDPGERVSIWRDKKLSGSDEFSNVLVERLNESKLVVAILSPSYIASKWCLREIDEFTRVAEKDHGLVIDNKARILKVVKTPVDREKHPAVLRGQLGYEFYVADKAKGYPVEFTLLKGDDNATRALQKINDVARNILKTLESLDKIETDRKPANEELGPGAPTVYLAETSYDLEEERDVIRREMEDHGIRVLPEDNLPLRNPEKFHEAVNQALDQCSLSIHIVGATRSVILPGGDDDTTSLQNKIAAELSENHKIDRLIWIPPGLVPEDDEQAKFIELLNTDIASQANAELLKVARHELQTIVLDTLQKQSQAQQTARGDHERKRIYLIYAHEDAEAARPIGDYLFDKGFEVLEPVSGDAADDEEIFEIHKRYLCDCDAALLFAHSAGEPWLKMQLSELLRAPAWRGPGRNLTAAIYMSPDAKKEIPRLRTHNLIIDGSEPFDPNSLTEFLDP